jgi:hypothetical protein
MREGQDDRYQDFKLWLRELEDLVREIREDPIFKGNQNFKFGCGKPRLGGLTVEEPADTKIGSSLRTLTGRSVLWRLVSDARRIETS